MKRFSVIYFILSTSVLMYFSFTGCSISTDDTVIEEITLNISLNDTTKNLRITGAEIYINNRRTQQKTPATFIYLTEGEYYIQIIPPELDYTATDTVVYLGNSDVMDITMLTGRASQTGQITVNTNTVSTRIYINDGLRFFTAPAIIEAVPGNYRISAWKNGYKSDYPSLQIIDLLPEQQITIDLSLSSESTGLLPGDLAPDFDLVSDLGDSCTLAQFRGNVVLINFAGFQCNACVNELPEIQQVYEDYYNLGFRSVVINVGWRNEGPEDFLFVRRELNISIPLYYGDKGSIDVVDLYDIEETPTNILIERSGIIHQYFGATTYDDLSQRIEDLLED